MMGRSKDGDSCAGGESSKRLRRSKQERRRIGLDWLEPGVSVAVIARAHGVNANQVFHWRKLLRAGLLDVEPASTQLMPVRIAEGACEERGAMRPCSGTIDIELGRARIRVEGVVDAESLRMILEHLGR